MVSSLSHMGNSFAQLIWAIYSVQLLGPAQCSWSTKTRCPKVSLGSLYNLGWSNRHKYNISTRKKEIFVENISKPMKLNRYLPLLHFSVWSAVVLHQKKKRRDFSIFLNPMLYPVIPVEHQAMDQSTREEKKTLPSESCTTTFHACFLLLTEASGNALVRSWILH